MGKLSFIYFGSSDFSATILKSLLESERPSLIITQPSKPKGRGLKCTATPVEELARERKIPFKTPTFFSLDLIKEISLLSPDLLLVVDYGKILPIELLNVAKKMPLGFHPSLLPAYRGSAPINWVIIKGEKYTGVSLFKLTQKLDAGPIILQRKIEIDEEENFFSLREKILKIAPFFILEGLEKIKKNEYNFTLQDETKVSFAPKLSKEDGRINWEKSAREIKNLVNGTLGWPGSFTYWKGKQLKILGVSVVEEETNGLAGQIVKIDKEGIYVATKKGILKIRKLKPEAKKEMDAYAFVCGYHLKIGDFLD